MIKIENVTYLYHDGHNGIHDITCSIGHEESVGLIGENGAGKTTLLLALCGLIPFKGKIIISGKEMNKKNAPALRKKIGMLFQEPDDQLFLPSVYENIEYGIRHLEEKKKRARSDEALKFIGMEGIGERHAYHLSVGEKKRVALSSVFVMQPEVYFFDEPAADLDPRAKKNIINIIKKVKAAKLIASHDLDMVFSLCTRIIILYKGRIGFDRETEYLKKHLSLLKKFNLD